MEGTGNGEPWGMWERGTSGTWERVESESERERESKRGRGDQRRECCGVCVCGRIFARLAVCRLAISLVDICAC